MPYSSNAMKKSYKTECDTQRIKNLIKLREEIAGLTQAEFIREVGFTKSDISNLESGEKLLSLYHIQAYRLYFKEKHNINISVDFLMGYTDIIKNESLDIAADLGLSDSAIESLKKIKECADEEITIKADLDMLNFIMSDFAIFDRFVSQIKLYVNSSEYTRPLYYDDLTNCFSEYDMPDIFGDGSIYLSIGHNNGNILHLGTDRLIEGYAIHCISKQLEEWRTKYKYKRK